VNTRRDFLRVGILGGSTLAIAFRFEDLTAAEGKSFAPNSWIRIEPDDTVVLTIGKSEMGQGVRTSLAMILADELEAEWRSVRLVQAEPGPQFSNLGTGGSFSVRGSWRALRRAGATAREMLVSAAAQRWKVDRTSCRAERGAVIHAATNRRLTYGQLTTIAATLPVPTQAPLKPIGDLRIVGQPTKRIDGPAIVTGTAKYGLDVKVPGMRYATIIRPPVLGGSVKSFEKRANVIRIKSGIAVVGDSTWAALKARDAVHVEFDAGPHGDFSSEKHAKRLVEAAKQPGYLLRKVGDSVGDPSLTATYIYPFYAHAPVETMNCVADVRGDRCEIWAPTQAPNNVQSEVAKLLGISPAAVTVHVTLIGGGFGRRLGWDYALEAAEVSKAIGAPVQVMWTRADDMKHGYFQAASLHQLSGRFDDQRKLVAWTHKKVSSLHNARGWPSESELNDPGYYRDSASWGVYDIPYNIPSIETRYVRVDTHVPIGPWRAVFSPSSTFARECFIDELAHEVAADPIDFRLQLLEGPDQVQAGDLTIDRVRLRRVLEILRTRSNWKAPLPAGTGRGVACNVYDGETHVGYVAEVSVTRDAIRVRRIVCVIDCGLIVNPLGIESQVEGGVIWGLSSALKGAITFRDGAVEQSTYGDFSVLRIDETPTIEVHLVPSRGDTPFGMGETTVPPIVPAVVNAIFAATGKRVRHLPIRPSDL
jgi:isoquinoline 1-oxidoreductase beta subunit